MRSVAGSSLQDVDVGFLVQNVVVGSGLSVIA